MKTAVLCGILGALIALLVGVAAAAPPPPDPGVLHITYVTYSNNGTPPGIADYIRTVFDDICKRSPKFAARYQSFDFCTVKYGEPSSSFPAGSALAILTPLKYIEYKEDLKDRLIPMLVATKGPSKLPYYWSAFISATSSSITKLDSPDIKTIYMLGPGSFSGHMAPLTVLQEENLIDWPTVAAVHKRWRVEFCSDHDDVIKKVSRDMGAIGCTWVKPSFSGVKVVMRHQTCCQDVICVTSDLRDFQNEISDSIIMTLAARTTPVEYLDMNGAVPYLPEHDNLLGRVRRAWIAGRTAGTNYTGMALFAAATLIVGVPARGWLVLRRRRKEPSAPAQSRPKLAWIAHVILKTPVDVGLATLLLLVASYIFPKLATLLSLLSTEPVTGLTWGVTAGLGVVIGLVLGEFSPLDHLVLHGGKLGGRAIGMMVGGGKSQEEGETSKAVPERQGPAA